MKEYEAVLFSEEKYLLGEGPLYDGRTGVFSWVDILGGSLQRLSPDGAVTKDAFSGKLCAAVPAAGGGYVLAKEKELCLFREGQGTALLNFSAELAPYQRCNDAKADPAGRLWFGVIVDDMEHKPDGRVYCYDGKALRLVEKAALPNGMAWNAAGTKFYLVDSLFAACFVYDYDKETGEIMNRRELFKIQNGLPDGLCIDEKDRLWVACWGGRVEQRDGETGELLATVAVPAARATSCCFKEDLLFITSYGDGLEGAGDGRCYTVKTDTRGPAADYAKLG